MAYRPRQQRFARHDLSWLSGLVDTMERVSSGKASGKACDASVHSALKARLAQPASGSRNHLGAARIDRQPASHRAFHPLH